MSCDLAGSVSTEGPEPEDPICRPLAPPFTHMQGWKQICKDDPYRCKIHRHGPKFRKMKENYVWLGWFVHVYVLLGSVWRLYPLRHTHKLTILDYFSLFGISFLFSEQNGTQACVAPVFPFVLIVLGDGSTCSGSYLLSYAVKCSSLAALWRQEVCAWKKLERETENHTTQQKTIWGKKDNQWLEALLHLNHPF